MIIVFNKNGSSTVFESLSDAAFVFAQQATAGDSWEGRAVAAAQRIQARADALKARIEADPEIGQLTAKLRESHRARSNDNKPGGRDLVGHSSVQAWSAGPIFPAVIARIEEYDDLHATAVRCFGPEYPFVQREWQGARRWELTYPGREPQRFGSYDAAEARAKELNAQRYAPA